MQSGTSFAVSSPFFKSRRREKCFDLGTNRHRKKSLVRTVQTFPLATLQRVFLARVPYIVLYILSLLSPSCQFSPPLIFSPLLRAAPSPRRPFSAPPLSPRRPLLRAAPSPRRPFSAPPLSPRRPFSTPPLLHAAPRSPFASLAQPSLPSPYSPPSPHPFDSRSKEISE